ncbi:MAG TPA: class I SAM-dependent methyltransferase [Flavitalea sp.]|nr:class I SAM-dependent methyltransferase [Flavitalea sp.]
MKILVCLLCAINFTAASCQQSGIIGKPHITDSTYVYRAPSTGGTGKLYQGREIASIMDASGSDWLERPSRPAEENTDLIIKSMQLKPGMVVADIGAGTGYYTFRMAKLVPDGKVYAVEIQEGLIKMLNQKKKEKKSSEVEVVPGDTLSVNLPVNTVDLAIMVDVYHELSWPREIIHAIDRSLKKDGRILLVEYRGEDPEVRIKPLHKTTVTQLTREMLASGFILDKQIDVLPIQHFLLFKRK